MSDFLRTYALDDIRIRSDGDGRTVEAYAAVFDVPTPIHDRDGHYVEEIDPAAFAKTLADNGTRFGVFYNHGLDIYGGAAAEFSKPIGVPVEVRADAHGLWTVTRYARTQHADEVLELIKAGAITGQSFSGSFLRSDPARAPRGGWRPDADGALRTVRRLEIRMREYGPAPFPAYAAAAIVGVRSLRDLLPQLLAATPQEPDQRADTTDPVAVITADTPEPPSHSDRHRHLRRMARETGGPLA